MKLPVNKIICGDCLDVMKDWPDNCVDLVLTDPPYGVDIDWWDVCPTKEFRDECLRISKTVVMFGGASMRSVVPFANLEPDRVLVWSPRFTLSHLCSNGLAWRWHPIWCWNLPKSNEYLMWDILDDNTECGNWWKHTCTKPLALMQKLVGFAQPNNLILDPFCGSGTTCVAAKMLGRCFIGIDISEEYCDIARQRLKGVRPNIFEKPKKKKVEANFGISVGKRKNND